VRTNRTGAIWIRLRSEFSRPVYVVITEILYTTSTYCSGESVRSSVSLNLIVNRQRIIRRIPIIPKKWSRWTGNHVQIPLVSHFFTMEFVWFTRICEIIHAFPVDSKDEVVPICVWFQIRLVGSEPEWLS
jgi:hypothetical protein